MSAVISNLVSAKVDVDGIDIHYDRKGNGTHVVLFLPGALGTLQTGTSVEVLRNSKTHDRILFLKILSNSSRLSTRVNLH